jgi:hypothetical protein
MSKYFVTAILLTLTSPALAGIRQLDAQTVECIGNLDTVGWGRVVIKESDQSNPDALTGSFCSFQGSNYSELIRDAQRACVERGERDCDATGDVYPEQLRPCVNGGRCRVIGIGRMEQKHLGSATLSMDSASVLITRIISVDVPAR